MVFQDFKNSFPKIHFGILIYIFVSKTFIRDIFYITEKKPQTKNNNFLPNVWHNIIVVSIFDCVKGIRLCSTVHHKYGHANRGTEIICIAFVASIFCYSKRSSTIQQSLQYVKGNLAYRNFSIFLPTWKTFADKLWNDFSVDLCLNFFYFFWAYQLAVLDSFKFYSMRNGSMISYPIFTKHKRIKTKIENKFI